jgi:hypothetical protein
VLVIHDSHRTCKNEVSKRTEAAPEENFVNHCVEYQDVGDDAR